MKERIQKIALRYHIGVNKSANCTDRPTEKLMYLR